MTHLYDATKKNEYLRNAISIWQQDIVSTLNLELYNRVAEFYWSIAKAQDQLGEYLDSAANFEKASLFFSKEGEKKPSMGAFYQEYSRYMEAWGEFEKAKQAHIEKNYSRAKEHYEKMASIFELTTRWNYLTPNYQAWASLEEAEACSRKENPSDAILFFKKSIGLFDTSKISVQTKLDLMDKLERENGDIIKRISVHVNEKQDSMDIKLGATKDVEEKENLSKILKACSVRREYCLGRIALEEAIILKKQGETRESSRKYGEAAKIFSNILNLSEDALIEIQPFYCISQAWQYLTQAEAEASPEKFNEAIKLFEKVKDQCSDEKTKKIIQGHTFFCKALESSTRYDDTRDSNHLAEAIENFENAANQYLKASFFEASEYAKANQRLFEAYSYMGKASKEMDPQSKAAYYSMSEKLFESAAGALHDSGYADKSDEINLMLDRVRKEREVAVTLGSMYKIPAIISPSVTYPVPLPTIEAAVGLEKFEKAAIQANPLISKKQCRIGEKIDVDIEIFNAGKGSATLLRIENLLFNDFKIIKVPEWSRLENTSLNLRNRTLRTQEIEDIKLSATPYAQGEYSFKPIIIYKNESGEISSFSVALDTIIVKELGISDWIRGPNRTKSKKS